MSQNFLDMPDDELPAFSEVEASLEVEQPEETPAASDASTTDAEAEQAALEAAAETDPEAEKELAEQEQEQEQPGKAEAEKEEAVEETNPLAEADDAVKPPKQEEKKPAEQNKAPEQAKSEETKAEQKEDASAKAPTDATGFMARVTAPFKANGREMSVKNADEAVRLMQMGANYSQKMAALKPHLTLMRQLEDAGLLNAEAVSNAIDLLKHKKPEAIAKLAKDSKVDPLDLDEKVVDGYKPAALPVNEQREHLEEVLDFIQDQPSYNRVLQTTKQYDERTRQVIVENPQVLELLEKQMTTGIYDIIDAEVNRRKALGQIRSNTPYLEAYQTVGDELNEKGAFNHLNQAPATEEKKEAPTVVKKVVTAVETPKTADNARRTAAAPTRTAAPVKPKSDFNPLALSDEEFEKLARR